MEAKDYVVNDVLRDGRRFVVPIYQRQYQWGQKRLEPFWADVVAKADEVLADESRFMHYMGALILAPTGDSNRFSYTPSIQVVDGQQRLTTFQLLLAAVRETASRLEIPDVGEGVREYIFNTPKSQDNDPNVRFKLSPTPSDRKLFWTLMEEGIDGARSLFPAVFYKNGKLIRGSAPRALAAYDFFLERIGLYLNWGVAENSQIDAVIADLEEDPEEAEYSVADRLGAVVTALLSRMKLVTIALGEADDAQVIFETLNSQAEPLLAMDLVRNNIFHRAERQGTSVDTLYAELWQPFETPFWKSDAPRARPVRPRIEHFLSHSLTAQTGAATSMRELYAEYRAFARPKGHERFSTVADELRALTQFVPVYKGLEGEESSDPDISWLGNKLSIWEVTTAYPLVFQIALAVQDSAERRQMYRMIYSYIVRRAVCLLGAKNLNNVFQRAVATMLRDGVSQERLTDYLLEQPGTAGRFPTDEEFATAIRSNGLYGRLNNPRLGDILWELELRSRSSQMEDIQRPPNLWIEHILPQSWSTNWPLPDGTELPLYSADPQVADLASTRRQKVDTLGNLTLTTDSLNISMGNEDFSAKLAKLKKGTLLSLNQWVLARASWSELEIEERGAYLAELATSVWPLPPSD